MPRPPLLIKCSECQIEHSHKNIYDYCTGSHEFSRTSCGYTVCVKCFPTSKWIKQACGTCDHNSCSNCSTMCHNCSNYHCSDCNYSNRTGDDCDNAMHPISWWEK